MLKKVSLVALGVFVAVYALSFTKFSSYTCTAWKSLKNEASKTVSIEFEIKRLKNEVNSLDDDLKKHRSLVAEKIEQVRELDSNVTQVRADLNERKDRMKKASAELDAGATRVVFNGREYSVEAVTKQLRSELATAKRQEVDIKNKEKLLEARKRSADLAEQQLSSIANQKISLMQKIEELEADYEAVRLASTESKISFDDSRLSGVKQDLEALQGRINREKTELELATKYTGAPVAEEKPSTEDVNRDLKTYLYGDKAENKVTTEKERK